MNPKIILTVATVAALCNVSSAIIPIAAGAGAVTLTLGAGVAPALVVGGAAVLKAIAVGAVLGAASRGRGRGRRSAEEDSSFAVVAAVEPAQCYQRLICDLATGEMPKSSNDVILNLFKGSDVPIESPKAVFQQAANFGDHVKNIKVCELQYSCPLTGEQINELI